MSINCSVFSIGCGPSKWICNIAVSLVAASLLTSGLAVRAQDVTGSHIKRKEAGATGRQSPRRNGTARPAFAAYSRCLAELQPVQARQVLNESYQSEAQSKALDALLRRATFHSDECFTADRIEITGSVASYVGSFADYFIRHHRQATEIDALVNQRAVGWREVRSVSRPPYERFGACVVDSAPGEVYALALSEPSSNEETAAIRSIVSYLSPCITVGDTIKFDSSSLRSILSVSLLQALEEHSDFLHSD